MLLFFFAIQFGIRTYFFFRVLITFYIRSFSLNLIFSRWYIFLSLSFWVIKVSKMNEYAIKIRCFFGKR